MLLEDFEIKEQFAVDPAMPLREFGIFKRKKTPPPVRFLVQRPERTMVEIGSSRYNIRSVVDATSTRSFTGGWEAQTLEGVPAPSRSFASIKAAIEALVELNTK